MSISRIIGIVSAIGLIAAVGAGALAYEPSGISTVTMKPFTLSPADIAAMRHWRQVADGHADICKANYDACMKNCAGATSCSNQCQTNYDGCMQNGQ